MNSLLLLLLAHGMIAFVAGAEGSRNREVSWVNPKLPHAPGLTHHTLRSQAMGRGVGYVVWVPDNYENEADRKYPVLYFLHGMGGNESADSGGFSSQVRKAVREGRMPPCLIVFPNGGRSMYREGVEKMILNELVPLIDDRYRTIPKPGKRGIAGFSMGGAGSIWLSLRHPETFGFAGSWGGGMWRMEAELLSLVDKHADTLRQTGFSALMINGDEDRPEAFKPLSERFKEKGIPHRIIILDKTPHRLGLYYEKAGTSMTDFIGAQLSEGRKDK